MRGKERGRYVLLYDLCDSIGTNRRKWRRERTGIRESGRRGGRRHYRYWSTRFFFGAWSSMRASKPSVGNVILAFTATEKRSPKSTEKHRFPIAHFYASPSETVTSIIYNLRSRNLALQLANRASPNRTEFVQGPYFVSHFLAIHSGVLSRGYSVDGLSTPIMPTVFAR